MVSNAEVSSSIVPVVIGVLGAVLISCIYVGSENQFPLLGKTQNSSCCVVNLLSQNLILGRPGQGCKLVDFYVMLAISS
jgi:hypothetical protein